jgi:hypothetical protein
MNYINIEIKPFAANGKQEWNRKTRGGVAWVNEIKNRGGIAWVESAF